MTPPDATATPMRALILQHEEPTPPGLVTEWLGGHGASVERSGSTPTTATWIRRGYDLIVSLGSEFARVRRHETVRPPRGEPAATSGGRGGAGARSLLRWPDARARPRRRGVSLVRLGDRLAPGQEHRPRDGAGRTVVPVALRHVRASARRDLFAETDVGPQAFVIGRSLGLQFHPEVTTEIMDDWVREYRHELDADGVDPDAPARGDEATCRGQQADVAAALGLVPPRCRGTPPAAVRGRPSAEETTMRGGGPSEDTSVFPRLLDFAVSEHRTGRGRLAHHDRRPAHPRRLLAAAPWSRAWARRPGDRRGGGRAGRAALLLLQPPLHERAAGAARRPRCSRSPPRRWRGSGSCPAARKRTRRRCGSPRLYHVERGDSGPLAGHLPGPGLPRIHDGNARPDRPPLAAGPVHARTSRDAPPHPDPAPGASTRPARRRSTSSTARSRRPGQRRSPPSSASR